MRKILYFIQLLLLITSIIVTYTSNTAYARQGNILIPLKGYIEKHIPEKPVRNKIIREDRFKSILVNRIGINNYRGFAYTYFLGDDDLQERRNSVSIANGNLYIEHNGYASLIPEYKSKMQDYIRTQSVKALVKHNPELVKNELQKFNIDINLNGNLIVSMKKNIPQKFLGNKTTSLDDSISAGITNTKIQNQYEKLSENEYHNIYYNYLLGKKSSHTIVIPLETISNAIIFRNPDDVKKYLAVGSYRFREKYSYDLGYRKYNISQIYKTFDNIYMLAPNKELSYHNIFTKGDDGNKYKSGAAIIENKEEKIYGGGVCGGATGMYQGSLSNANIDLTARNHSWWYNTAYAANIDGEFISTPGLDATYFNKWLDVTFKNNSQYPVFLVSIIDVNNVEKNFTLDFKWNLKKTKVKFIKKSGKCYYWKRGEQTITSCYKKGV